MLQNSLCCTTPSYLGLLLFLGGKDFQFSLEGIHQELLVWDVVVLDCLVLVTPLCPSLLLGFVPAADS
jgi:hypothetical protein